MPTTFTHDVFGKEVFSRLPEELKNTIRQGKDLYRIGLHGPDIFFYYHPMIRGKIYQIGHQMHYQEARDFFERSAREYRRNPDPQLASYLLGFGCHFLLDSRCHPYVWAFEKEKGVSHAEIETELDRHFMIREHRRLFWFCPAGMLKSTPENSRVIARVFPEAGEKAILHALKSQKMFDRLLVCRHPWKEKLVLGGMKLLGCYDALEGQVMRRDSNPVCRESTAHLLELYENALEEAPGVLENLYGCLLGTEELTERFDQNYEG